MRPEITDPVVRQFFAALSLNPCIVAGCVLADEHQGRHKFRCENPQCGADLGGDFTRRYCSDECTDPVHRSCEE